MSAMLRHEGARKVHRDWIAAECAVNSRLCDEANRLLDPATGEPDFAKISRLAYQRARYRMKHCGGTLADQFSKARAVLIDRIPHQQHLFREGAYQ